MIKALDIQCFSSYCNFIFLTEMLLLYFCRAKLLCQKCCSIFFLIGKSATCAFSLCKGWIMKYMVRVSHGWCNFVSTAWQSVMWIFLLKSGRKMIYLVCYFYLTWLGIIHIPSVTGANVSKEWITPPPPPKKGGMKNLPLGREELLLAFMSIKTSLWNDNSRILYLVTGLQCPVWNCMWSDDVLSAMSRNRRKSAAPFW